MSYEAKYLKYKNKYLELKKLMGGADVIVPCDNPSGFGNKYGTCWNSSINSILMYGMNGEETQKLLLRWNYVYKVETSMI